MKYLLSIIVFSILHFTSIAQDTQHVQKQKDIAAPVKQRIVSRDSFVTDTARKKVIRAKPVRLDSAQNDSSAITTNTSLIPVDSLKNDSVKINTQKKVAVKKNAVVLMPGIKRNIPDRDILFYILIFLLFFLGLVKTSFPKYVNNIFSLSFQATFRQTQTKEQMSQNFFPAFMLNLLFVLCGGLFITQYAQFNNWSALPFWQLFVYSTIILLGIYIIKYAVISFTGWVFNAKDAATEYRFVVFLINKLLGILIIPLLFLIAYSGSYIQNIFITIVICLAVFSLAVRYLVSLARIRKNLSVTAFHFFIYLCAIEIMPLLVIYKLLFQQASNR